MMRKILGGVALSLASFFVDAQADAVVPQSVYESLKKIAPDSAIADVSYHDGVDMYYFQTDRGVDGFISADGRYVMPNKLMLVQTDGSLIDESLRTAKRDVLAMDDSQFIVYPARGEEKGSVIIFGDITCEYCKLVHDRIGMMTDEGITVRYMAFPRSGLTSVVARNMNTVWCAQDPLQALSTAVGALGDQAVIDAIEVRENCQSAAVSKGYLKAKALKLSGTPAFLFESGTLRSGYMMYEDVVAQAKQDRQQTKVNSEQ